MTLDEVYKQWFKPVRAWIRKRNVPPLWVDDVTQEVFLKLLRYNPEVEIDTNLAGYVFRTATNVANEWMELSHVRKPHGPEGMDEIVDSRESAEEGLEQHQMVQQIELAMSRIEGRRLLVLMMHVYENKTYEEIAVELGLTHRVVSRDLARTYGQLRRDMRDTGF